MSSQPPTLAYETPPALQPRLLNTPVVALLISGVILGAGVLASIFLSRPGVAPGFAPYWPLVVLVLSVGLVITLITVVKLHAFIALILAAIAAGLLSRVGVLSGAPNQSHWVRAVELSTVAFGQTCASIGVVIALASVIGMCLLESGAADKIVRHFLRLFGQKHAGLALLVSTYIVSIPIFFDTIFMLLIPLAKALRLRTGKDYLLYVLAICCAGVVTHSMVIPHPGPAAMADALHVDPGLTIIVGLITGALPCAIGWLFCRFINRRMDVPLVETPGSSLADLEALMGKPERELPSLPISLTPVLLPVLLIGLASFVAALYKQQAPGPLATWLQFLGNRNIALIIGAFISIFILMRQRRLSFSRVADLIGPPLETAGVVILITAAGGAFGLMLKNAGVGEAIKTAASGYNLNLILLSWIVALIIRIAQGSATVAMLTTSAMIYPLMTASQLPYDPVYIFLAIGYGAMGASWMNDSGFWVVSRLGGLSEKQTLRSWTLLLTVISVAGLLTALLFASLLPRLPFMSPRP